MTDITPGAFNRLILIQQQDHPYVIEALPQAPSSYHFLSLLSFQSIPDATILSLPVWLLWPSQTIRMALTKVTGPSLSPAGPFQASPYMIS